MREKLENLPDKPGSYQMLDKDGMVIYVGKAKNLKKRVKSYFSGSHTGKTLLLVSEIVDFTFIVTSSELEAFILEINLIKKYDPKYNILLKDDKSYPYIEYSNIGYPSLKVARYLKLKKSGKKYIFGPFPNSYAARRIVKLLNRLYPLKKCEGNLRELCLYYHINECLGYCCIKPCESEVKKMESEILSFLRGNDSIVRDKILKKIDFFNDQLNFEASLELHQELLYIDTILKKQSAEIGDLVVRDIVSFFEKDGMLGVYILFIRGGKIVDGHFNCFHIISTLEDELLSYLISFYSTHEIAREIVINSEIDKTLLSSALNTRVCTYSRGKIFSLINMARENAKIFLEQEIKLLSSKDEREMGALNKLSEILSLNIHRIDAFDNSNLFGTYCVSGMVVFVNGKPKKTEYRKYKLVLGDKDDYHMMKEVIYRRYQKALLLKNELPQLIIVDGGIIQINAAKEVLLSLNLNIMVVGLKKDDKHRTNALINGNTLEEINLSDNHNLFLFLTKIQDEVHRYTINYHKTLRSKGMLESVLDNIDGVGSARKKILLEKFGNIKKISEASLEELTEVVSLNVANNLKKYFESK